MSASEIVPLTVTYAPSGAATTTVTVLGQVLNNGGTNWIPTGTSDNAIYLATTSEPNASQTVLEGTTYYLSPGPAVPAQVTLSVSGSGPASSTTMGASGASSSGAMGAGPTTSMGMSSPSMGAAASSSSSTTGAASSLNCGSAGRMGLVLGLLCGLGIVAA